MGATPEAFAEYIKKTAKHAAYMAEIDHGEQSESDLLNLGYIADAMAAALAASQPAPVEAQAVPERKRPTDETLLSIWRRHKGGVPGELTLMMLNDVVEAAWRAQGIAAAPTTSKGETR